jgi:LPS-assembly lipoprotein
MQDHAPPLLLSRRALLRAGSLAPLLALPGCGFSPVYATSASGDPSPAAAELAAITIGRIPDRSGQELSEALQERFNYGGVGIARRYDLDVNYSIGEESVGIQPDTSVTYQRVIANATWTLRGQDPQHTTITTGKAHAIDGYNFIDQQFFDSTLEDEKVRWRLSRRIADMITMELLGYFKHHPAKTDDS